MPAIKVKRPTKKVLNNPGKIASLARKIKSVDTQDWIYVSPKDNMWVVRKDGAQRATRRYPLKSSALSAAKRIVQVSGNSRIIIYNLEGEISKIIG